MSDIRENLKSADILEFLIFPFLLVITVNALKSAKKHTVFIFMNTWLPPFPLF